MNRNGVLRAVPEKDLVLGNRPLRHSMQAVVRELVASYIALQAIWAVLWSSSCIGQRLAFS